MGFFDRFKRTEVYYVEPVLNDVRVLDMDTEKLYRSQPNLRAVVDFLSDNIAQLPLKAYRRVSDTDRQRVTDGVAYQTLTAPNKDMTGYELINTWCHDWFLYGRICTVVARSADTLSGWELRPIPIPWIVQYKGKRSFAPEAIEVTSSSTGGERIRIEAKDLLMFHNYNPQKPWSASSPVAALKQTLTEQVEADRYRLSVWKKGGRFETYITRPKDVSGWTEDQAKKWMTAFRESWTGNSKQAGGIPLLEDGMEIKSKTFNAKEAEWAQAKILSRSDVAAVYHVNPSLIWHDEAQTYASAKDNARAFYSDTLAPILRMLQDRLNMFLLPKLGEDPDVYVEFDLQAKLQGSFEEQVQAMQSAVGGPYMLRSEARARLNLPDIDGADELIVPLNVTEGGLASPRDTAPPQDSLNAQEPQSKAVECDCCKPKQKSFRSETEQSKKAQEEFTAVYQKHLNRQKNAILPKLGAKADEDWWDSDRWNSELAEDLLEESLKQSTLKANSIAENYETRSDYVPEKTVAYLQKMAQRRASAFNDKTYELLDEIISDPETDKTPKDAFTEDNRAQLAGRAISASVMAFACHEFVKQCLPTQQGVMKTWIVTSGNSRHPEMNGETVPYSEAFSNGGMFPGDEENLDISETARCECVLEIVVP